MLGREGSLRPLCTCVNILTSSQWIYLQTRFYGSHGEQDIRAQSLAQYVLKRGRKTIKPEALFDTCGYDLSQAVLARNAESLAVAAAISKLGAHEPWQ